MVTGILAHVDAGKTTCIESMLFQSGEIKKAGRVDHKDAFLDFDTQERDHGITIYSKEAHFIWQDTDVYVIDTPGHVDFSAEMERALQAIDIAVMLINGQDGVQSHTETIWKCLAHYNVPVIVFVNKMDISHLTRQELLEDLQKRCSDNCIDFTADDRDDKLAMVSDEMLNTYLEEGSIREDQIKEAVFMRKCFPVLFGSALKNTGVKELMDLLVKVNINKEYPKEFGARVYKISTDEQGNRLTHVKITGGSIQAKDKLNENEKIDQIRIYNGRNYQMIQKAEAGMICCLKGLTSFEIGSGLGFEEDAEKPLLNAYLNYELVYPHGCDVLSLTETCKAIADEDPQLEISTDEKTKKIQVQIMGEMQMEVLQKKILERCGISVGFGTGRIVYMESINEPVTGVGHFEPLRHYAEVVVRLEPLPRGKGILFENRCSRDSLSMNWQRAIMTALSSRRHRGVLTGSLLTDVRICLLAGKGHIKHTEGGDFRQAASRAVRQGLMKTESVLLEPYYDFELTVPADSLSRALYDLDLRKATVQVEEVGDSRMKITGSGPIRTLLNYQNDVISYTKGKGRFFCTMKGYDNCLEQDKIIAETMYDPENDLRNPTGSVFCTHGSGYYVPWDEVEENMHINLKSESISSYTSHHITVSNDDLENILSSATSNNRNANKKPKPKKKEDESLKKVKASPILEPYWIVDGYNMIYSWDDLKEEARENLYGAREHLVDRLLNLQAYRKVKMMIVFDGYRVQGNIGTKITSKDVTIVYTKTDETADEFIEKTAYDLKGKYNLYVATSDGLIQNAVFAQGANRIPARQLIQEIEALEKQFR